MDDVPNNTCHPSAQGATAYAREATSPQLKPAVPPKPNARIHTDATTVKSADAAVTQGFSFPRRHSVTDTSPSFVPSSRYPSSPNAPQDPQQRFRFQNSTATAIPTTSDDSRPIKTHGPLSPTTGLSHSPSFTGGSPSYLTNKPALPPKPVVTSQTASPPPCPVTSDGKENGKLNEPPPFLRAKPPQPTPQRVLLDKDVVRDPPRPRITCPPQPRPKSSATFNFSSPIQNLNSANFPSTGVGLNQMGIGPLPSNVAPKNLSQIRAKSASLGRNITFPFSAAPTPIDTGGGFFSKKSSTLSKFKIPGLDLQLGSSSKPLLPTAGTVVSPSRPKPDSLKFNPFIIKQKEEQQQKRAQESQANNNLLNFGKSIAFSPDSPLPPPPPPRLRKKLSPVSPNPPSPFHMGNAPLTPNSPSRSFFAEKAESGGGNVNVVTQMESLHESTEDVTAIYAEINKEKKWADRKLKQNELTRKLSLDSSLSSPTQEIKNDIIPLLGVSNSADIDSIISDNNNDDSQPSNVNCCNKDNPCEQLKENPVMDSGTGNLFQSSKECETEVVSSWLRSRVNGTVSPVTIDSNPSNSLTTLSGNNPFRSVTPTYQSTNTGHIYETIGERLNARDKNLCPDRSDLTTSLEIHETSEVIQTDELCDNKSFLFKLVINPKKGNDAEPSSLPNLSSDSVHGEELSMDTRNNNNVEGDTVSGKANSEDEMTTIETTVPSHNSNLTGEHENLKTKMVLNSTSYTSQMRNVGDSVDLKNVLPDVIHSYLIPTVIQDISLETPSLDSAFTTEEITSPTNNILQNESLVKSPFQSPESEPPQAITSVCNTTPSPSVANSILRRRSWNCDRVYTLGSGRSSPSESSSTTSSVSNIPGPHRRDKSLGTELDWVDEGDLSNGALADTETSDVQMRSSAEDVNLRKWATATSPSGPSKGFSSRRFVSSIFSSFGKGSSSSSGRSSVAATTGGKKGPVVVRQSLGGRRTKDKTVSHVVTSDFGQQIPRVQNDGSVAKLGRQISESVIFKPLISSPILPSSVSFDSGMPPHHKIQSVQFSPDVLESSHFYIREQCTEEEDASPDANDTKVDKDDGSSPGSLMPSLSALPVEGCCVDRIDDGSVSSSDSASGCGSVSGTSVSGYEDILAELSPNEKKSFYVAREILTSERTFVDVLNLLTIDFPKFLDNTGRYLNSVVISKEDMGTILGGLPNLKQVNENLVAELEERIAHWKDSPKIADILVKTGPFLKLYASYIKDFQKNSMYLDTCCQKYPLFSETLKNFESSERCQKLGLKHYMLKPVQRMPQYRLLLEDYLKSLDAETSSDYDDTVKGIAIVKEVAEHANEAIRLQVNAEKLLHLQNRLSTGTVILKADRQLIKEGELRKICRKELQPRFFALMNDCLFCLTYHASTGAPKDLKLRYELPLAGMRVSLSPTEDYQNEFSVISVARSFNLVAKSNKERDEWMKALNAAITDNIKKRTCTTPDNEIRFQLGKEAPVWIPDSRVTMCQLCTAEFTVTFRRHHCRACGKVVCGNCSSGLAPLQYLKDVASRVCDSCYEYLLDEFDAGRDDESDHINSQKRASIRDRFKKNTPNVSKRATKIKRIVPSRLEVQATCSGSRISGYLTWRERERKSWKRRWFVLIDRVLYIYAASEDIVAIKSIPLLGWQVEPGKPDPQQEYEDNQAFFRLTHTGQHPIWFQADSSATAEKWIAAMSEAVVLS